MQDRELYARILGLKRPWRVTGVEFRAGEGEVLIYVGMAGSSKRCCPGCKRASPGYDTRERRWRHLDTCQYRTILVAEIPRVDCPEHGVVQIQVPWADSGSRFTALFEALVIDWLHEASVSAVAWQLGLTWDQVAGIQQRSVRRGLARREARRPRRIGVDETSFQRRHKYVTVVNDLADGTVLHVADGRTKEALDGFYRDLGSSNCSELESVAMDMSAGYISSTQEFVPDADRKIVFDKFHIAQHLGEAVDKVRRTENRELTAKGDDRLKKTKYWWLIKPSRMKWKIRQQFSTLRQSRLRVARAWAIREAAMLLWGYVRRGWAERAWKQWCSWAMRSRLEPIKRVARMIRNHWEGVMNAVTRDVTNARSESVNARIQWVKRMACGFRSRESFRNAIYFHLGGLDLRPETLIPAHSKA